MANFKLLVLSWNPTLGTVPYDLYVHVGNIYEMFWPSQFLSNTITRWSILGYIPWAHVLWLSSLCYWDVNKNATTSFELQYSKTSWEMFQCFWHSLALSYSVFRLYLFTYTCCKEFQFGNEFDSYETKWQLHCCLMRWHFLKREFIKSKLGRSSYKKLKLGKNSINVIRCGFIDIRWTAIFLIDFVEIKYPLK